jgi:hypothetical protein
LEELPKLEAEEIQKRSISVWLGNPSQTDDDAKEKRIVLRDLERQASGGSAPKQKAIVATPEMLQLMGVGFRKVTDADLARQQTT